MAWLRRVFWFGDDAWDPSHRFETSWLLKPWTLFFVRATFSLYAFVVLFFNIIWQCVASGYGGCAATRQSFSFFTVLTYWGLAFYFLFAALHTFTYARTGSPLLNRFPRALQALHSFYYTTIVCYPPLVTIVYWTILYPKVWWAQDYFRWSNISQHAMNSLFAFFELFLTRANPPPFIHLLGLIIILALYLGLAYLTYVSEHVYVYSFLDPSGGHSGRTAGYIFGIAGGIIVIFLIVKILIWGRKWVTEVRMGQTGKFHGGRAMGQGDVDVEARRKWQQ